MRILHVIARMNVGGTATYLSGLISGQMERGDEVLLLTGSVPNGETEDLILGDLPYIRIPSMSRKISVISDIKARSQIMKRIEDFQPDLVHSHTFKAGLLVRSIGLKVPVVHSFHGHHLVDPEFGLTKNAVLNLIEKLLCKRSSALIAIGERVREELIEVGIGKSIRFVSIPPGIDELRLPNPDVIRRQLHLDVSAFVVMWLGRFTLVKRPDLVVEVARLLPEMTFVMAGGGELFETVRAIAPKNVVLCGYRDRNEMWAIADVALCTSDSEGMPLSLIEAQLCGVPVVSRDVGSVSEILEDGSTGTLTGNTAENLMTGLDKVRSMIDSNPDLASYAIARAREKFSIAVMVNAHQELYKEVLREFGK